jgi:hypothetical protein
MVQVGCLFFQCVVAVCTWGLLPQQKKKGNLPGCLRWLFCVLWLCTTAMWLCTSNIECAAAAAAAAATAEAQGQPAKL